MKPFAIIGSAQFGLPYGITNSSGQVDFDEVTKILNLSYTSGIRFLDTAEMYGNSIEVLGDYFKNHSEPEVQKKVFKEQMEVAQDLDKPVIIHSRDADADLIQIISEYSNVIGVAHCFSSTLETAQAFLELGYYISFSGNITFKNSHLPEVVKSIPLDRIMVETDSPFLSPEPERGKGNEPSLIVHTVSKLSEIHGISYEEMAKHTYDNTTELFRLP